MLVWWRSQGRMPPGDTDLPGPSRDHIGAWDFSFDFVEVNPTTGFFEVLVTAIRNVAIQGTA